MWPPCGYMIKCCHGTIDGLWDNVPLGTDIKRPPPSPSLLLHKQETQLENTLCGHFSSIFDHPVFLWSFLVFLWLLWILAALSRHLCCDIVSFCGPEWVIICTVCLWLFTLFMVILCLFRAIYSVCCVTHVIFLTCCFVSLWGSFWSFYGYCEPLCGHFVSLCGCIVALGVMLNLFVSTWLTFQQEMLTFSSYRGLGPLGLFSNPFMHGS